MVYFPVEISKSDAETGHRVSNNHWITEMRILSMRKVNSILGFLKPYMYCDLLKF